MGSYESDCIISGTRSDPVLYREERNRCGSYGDESDGISLSHLSLDPLAFHHGSDQFLSGDSDLDQSDSSHLPSHCSSSVYSGSLDSSPATESIDECSSYSRHLRHNTMKSRMNLPESTCGDADDQPLSSHSGSDMQLTILDGKDILNQVHFLLNCGEFVSARILLNSSLQDHFEDYGIVSRALLIEERFNCLEGVLAILFKLQKREDFNCLKVLVEACLIAAKLGDTIHVNNVFEKLVFSHLGKQGNLALNHILFVHRSIDYQQALSLSHMYSHMYPKHGPLWFFSFQEQEHLLVVLWEHHDMEERIRPMLLLKSYAEALLTISHELRWKVFFIAAQMYLHTYVQLLLSVTKNIDRVKPFHSCGRRILHIAKYYTACSLRLCPRNLRWKVWLLAARLSVFSTDRATARHVCSLVISYHRYLHTLLLS